jgi:hypothetical protein
MAVMEPEHLRTLREAAMRDQAVVKALAPQAPDSERAAAAMQYVTSTIAYLRALAKDPAPGEWGLPASERRAVMAALLETRDLLRPSGAEALAGMVHVAACGLGETENERADWAYARAVLLDHGFLTAAELDTFPLASQLAIVRDRFHRWEATGDAWG